MFGNLINNTAISSLLEQGDLIIDPFDRESLQLAQYPLRAQIIWEVLGEGKGKPVHNFSKQGDLYEFKPKTYYWLDVLELIELPRGIVGRFIPSSNLIEKGLGLTAGKIESPFGKKGEKIRFGLYNYLNNGSLLMRNDRIAYLQFIDLRGLDNKKYAPSKYENDVYTSRLSQDDGPNYEIDNDD